MRKLVSDARKHNFALSTSVIFKLLSIKNVHERQKIQERMMRENWSLRQLKAHLSVAYGVAQFGGRHTWPKSFQHGAFEAKQALHLATQILETTLRLKIEGQGQRSSELIDQSTFGRLSDSSLRLLNAALRNLPSTHAKRTHNLTLYQR